MATLRHVTTLRGDAATRAATLPRRALWALIATCALISLNNRRPTTHTLGDGDDEDSSDRPSQRWGRLAVVNGAAQFRRCPQGIDAPVPPLEGLSVRLPFKRGKRVALDAKDVFLHADNAVDVVSGRRQALLNRSLHRHLPANGSTALEPFANRRCAVVGNSGLLKANKYGTAIDSHQVVVRINHAPVKDFEAHVGSKTTARVLNLLWSERYALGSDFVHTDLNCGETKYVADLGRDVCVGGYNSKPRLPLENGAKLVCSRVSLKEFAKLSHTMNVDRFYRSRAGGTMLITSHVIAAARRLLVGYRVRLCASGRGPFNGGAVPSSGLVAIFIMLNVCSSVDVYGFGSNQRVLSHVRDPRKIEYHYFNGFGKRDFGTPVHSWEAEQALMERLAEEGVINLCLNDGAYRPEHAARMGADAGRATCGMSLRDADVLRDSMGGEDGLRSQRSRVQMRQVRPNSAPDEVRAWMHKVQQRDGTDE